METGHDKSLTITLPSISYDYLQHSITLFIICPASTCVLQCAWISVMQLFYLSSSSASAGRRHFCCTSASTLPQESTHILHVFVSRTGLFVGCTATCPKQGLVPAKQVYPLSPTEKFCSKCGHFTSHFTNLLLEKKEYSFFAF